MSVLSKCAKVLRRFGRDEEGSIAVETILMVPLLSWAMLSTLAYFDAYRAQAIAQRASLTIADMYSRETDYITPTYLTGTIGLLQFLTLDDPNPAFRVTVLKWSAADDNYVRIWSRNRGGMGDLDSSGVQAVGGKLPALDDGEVAILVQTEIDYSPPYSVGLEDFTIETFTLTSPRFATQLCWNATPDDDTTAVC